MAKPKGKKVAPDKARRAKSAASRKNPFEIRFTKEKHVVMNRKTKSESGNPGISRAKAIQIRKDTLLREYRNKDKSNVIIDRRIGEKDTNLSGEDKMTARFAMERSRAKGGRGGSIFNLGDEEPLTHLGKSLAQVETFEDPRSDEDEDDDGAGHHHGNRKKMDAEGHFGGFLTRSDIEFSQGKSNTRKDWIEGMIAESKKKKFDRMKAQEEAQKMTQDLDDKWKELTVSLTGQIYSKKEDKGEGEGQKDDYNQLLKELMFQPKKAKAQDRLKTEEEVVSEEKERLEKLEDDRLRRMNGDVSDDEEEEEEEDEEDRENVSEGGGGDDGSSSGGEEEEDGYSDLEEEEEKATPPKRDLESLKRRRDLGSVMSEARKEIPFTFEIPSSYEGLVELLSGRTPSERATVVERMIKCNHPQFGASNVESLEALFRFLLQFLHDCGTVERPDQVADSLESVAAITPFLYDLCKFSPAPNAKAVLSVVQEKFAEAQGRSYPTLESLIFMKLVVLLFPASDYRHPVVTPTLLWMSRVLSRGRPGSRFSIVSGLFVSSVLTEAVSLSRRFSPELLNFLSGLVHVSCPDEGAEKKPAEVLLHHVPPFRPIGRASTILFDRLRSGTEPKKLKLLETLVDEPELPIDEEFAASALNASVELLDVLAGLWKDLPAAKRVFGRLTFRLLPNLPLSNLHPALASKVEELRGKLEALCRQKTKVPPLRKDPIKMLRLHEPLIEEDFDPFQKKRRGGDRDALEMQKLQHKVKRERKAAKKDLRRDASFLAKTKQKEARDRDLERVSKTRSLMNNLGSQEGEYRKFLAGKSKRKK